MVVTVEQMKRLEKKTVELGSSYLQLMEQAGSAAANLLVERYFLIGKQVVILTGSGNNGGDGYVIARKLLQRGAQVTVILCKGMPSTSESQENFQRLDRSEIRVLDAEKQQNLSYQAIREGDFVLDCIFGTGFHGAVRGTALGVLSQANRCGAMKVAVDLPSGLSGDSGEIAGEFFHADLTIALGEKKPVHVTMPAAKACGEIVTVDIGIPKAAYEGIETHHGLLTKELFSRLGLPPVREPESNKGT
ncbi:MAG TPA: NAD(P)H-hydrate epimerase, partial [Candidatus Egerieicola pullicola]|nr:NAD(P)H-hydrate epimerase [Candidatus Egerieicola pullicola]